MDLGLVLKKQPGIVINLQNERNNVLAIPNQQIIKEILDHVRLAKKSTWYVGIAASPKTTLFNRHNVDVEKGRWIYKQANSEAEARATEKSLLEYGFDGGDGGGITPNHVYAYEKAWNSRP